MLKNACHFAGPGIKFKTAMRPATILVVDDNVAVRTLVCRVLSIEGYNVLEAASGREALSIAGNLDAPFDLLLTDVKMPEMDGVELARRLKESAPAHRVLFISGQCEMKEI